MFPIKDSTLNVVGFSGRALSSKEDAKYINSMETPLFKKVILFITYMKKKI